MDVDELAHAFGEVDVGAALGDLGVAPWPVHVERHEDVRGAVATVLVVVARSTPGLGAHRYAFLTNELSRCFVEADDSGARRRLGRVQIKDVLHSRDEFSVDLWDTPHL